jgi:probable phosphoglycerate mutase
MNAPESLWLIRHGETEWSRSGAHTGRTDLSLTNSGQQRAAAMGRYLAGRRFALVLTSPLLRAKDTCRIAGYSDTAQIEPNLREWDYGEYEGRTTADIRREVPNWSLWTMGVRGGETIQEVAHRARLVIERVSSVPGDVALFAHGHILRILTACWLDLPPDAGRLFALDTGSLSVLGYERDTRVIQRWNFSPEV